MESVTHTIQHRAQSVLFVGDYNIVIFVVANTGPTLAATKVTITTFPTRYPLNRAFAEGMHMHLYLQNSQ